MTGTHGIGTAAAQRGCFCARCTVPAYWGIFVEGESQPRALFLCEDDAGAYDPPGLSAGQRATIAKVAITIAPYEPPAGGLSDGDEPAKGAK